MSCHEPLRSDNGGTVSAAIPLDRDALLEAEIDAAYESMIHAKTDEESKAHFHDMARLIARRSPMQIQKMELTRRLLIKQAREAR
jgi:hypothetical protein